MRVSSSGDTLLHEVLRGDSIALLTNPRAGEEALAAALALRLVLTDLGKQVDVIYPASFSAPFHELPGGDTIVREFPPRDLVVRFALNGADIERMSYYVKDGVCHVVVSPEQGFMKPGTVSLSHQSFQYDALVTMGYSSLEEVNEVYGSQALDVATTPVVNIDTSVHNTNFGRYTIVDAGAAGISEVVFMHLGQWGLRPGYEAAECLLFGLGMLNNREQGGITEARTESTIASTIERGVAEEMLPRPPVHSSGTVL